MVYSIAAIDDTRGIATDSGIPWDLPTDRAFFRDHIQDSLIVMGGSTYRETKMPMGKRENFVITHATGPLRSGFTALHDLDAFFAANADENVAIVGGAGIYELTLQFVETLLLTHVSGDFDCTKFFPNFETAFELTNEQEPTQENGITYQFQTWHRSKNSQTGLLSQR